MTVMPIMAPPVMAGHVVTDQRPAYAADHRPGGPGDDKTAGGSHRGAIDRPIGERGPTSAKGNEPSHTRGN